ncbi:hypothetical protein CL656_02890 [bacterium]|nr:hypothetical protein [bacterium]|tara:strand:- start:2414 stop:2641 length:228 start_codon:yes stop_codon:yes gene_type:complete
MVGSRFFYKNIWILIWKFYLIDFESVVVSFKTFNTDLRIKLQELVSVKVATIVPVITALFSLCKSLGLSSFILIN